jgi:hypothetical protein
MPPKKAKNWDWRADLAAARDVEHRQREGYRGFLEWFENWRLRLRLEPSRETATAFWNSQVIQSEKLREKWQLAQWGAAMGWYLNWLSFCKEGGGVIRVGCRILTFSDEPRGKCRGR